MLLGKCNVCVLTPSVSSAVQMNHTMAMSASVQSINYKSSWILTRPEVVRCGVMSVSVNVYFYL